MTPTEFNWVVGMSVYQNWVTFRNQQMFCLLHRRHARHDAIPAGLRLTFAANGETFQRRVGRMGAAQRAGGKAGDGEGEREDEG